MTTSSAASAACSLVSATTRATGCPAHSTLAAASTGKGGFCACGGGAAAPGGGGGAGAGERADALSVKVGGGVDGGDAVGRAGVRDVDAGDARVGDGTA